MYIPVSPDLFVGGMQIHLYSVFVGLGLLSGYLVVRWFTKFHNLSIETVDNLVLVAILSGFLGARLFFVFGHWNYYSKNLSEILNIFQGGIAFYGGIIGASVGILIVYLYKKFDFLKIADGLVLGLALGQGIGRWGNFFNSEAYGKPTDLPWGIFISLENRVEIYKNYEFFHPTFFYESLGLILLFFLLLRFAKSRNFRSGMLLGLYATVSGAMRFFIEYLRVDALQVGSVMISQIMAIMVCIFGVGILLYIYKKDERTT